METIHRKTGGKAQVRVGSDVRNDLVKMKLIKWAEQVQDRRKWEDIVGRGKSVPEL
jgi:hypothetical protein